MRNFWREYGLIAFLIVIAMAGYLFYYQTRGDVLSTSLNVISDRLITMVLGGESASGLIDQFKTSVLGQDAPAHTPDYAVAEADTPVTAEAPAAADEIEITPQPSFASATAVPAPAAPPESPASPSTPAGAGDMSVFVEEIRRVFPDDPELRQKLSESVHLSFEDGLRITIDNEAKQMMREEDRKQFLAAIRKLERQKRALWAENLARVIRKRVEVRHYTMDMMREESGAVRESPVPYPDPAHRSAMAQVQKSILAFREAAKGKALASLATLRRLAMLRNMPPATHDSMRLAVQQAMNEALARAKAASGELARHAGRESFDTAMKAYQRQLDAYLESYEARLESVLDSLETTTDDRVDAHPEAPFAAVYARAAERNGNPYLL
ncbi:hypothetical protein [Rhodocaloribacter sp.]